MNKAALFYVEQSGDRVHCFVLRVSPNVSTGYLFICVSIPFVFCAPSGPTNKRNREQKHITKTLLSFLTSSLYQLCFGRLFKVMEGHERSWKVMEGF